MTIDHDVWQRARLADGPRTTEVRVRFDLPSRHGDEGRASGALSCDTAIPIGKALQLRLDDGRRALIVVVDGRGRFLTSGPVWHAN